MKRFRDELGQTISMLRLGNNLSLEGLGERCGIHRNSVERIELAKSGVRMDTFMQLSRALGVPAWKILRHAEKSLQTVNAQDSSSSEDSSVSSST